MVELLSRQALSPPLVRGSTTAATGAPVPVLRNTYGEKHSCSEFQPVPTRHLFAPDSKRNVALCGLVYPTSNITCGETQPANVSMYGDLSAADLHRQFGLSVALLLNVTS